MTWTLLAIAAVVVPTLLAFNVPPSATFLNQAAALVGWGFWLAVLAMALPSKAPVGSPGLKALLAVLAVLFIAAAASPFWTHLPSSLALSSLALIGAAGLAVAIGAALQSAGLGVPAFRAFCIALVIAGVCSSAIGIVQVFAPKLADGTWIARSVLDGRAVGNLRQPNHLSSLLLWSLIAAVWLGEARVISRVGSTVLSLLFIFVTVLSASRTGAVGALMLGVWGLADRRMSRHGRWLLAAMPIAYIAFWGGTSLWANLTQHVFGGETRFSGAGDVSSSRFGIWANTLALIAAHPWLGVGFGEFNLAWSLTPFPGRPGAFFDHTHDLPLQFAVELGVPLALLLTGLLMWALAAAFRAAFTRPQLRQGEASDSSNLRAAFLMVLMISVHSLLEYPLWYAYFLLPAAFAFGLCLGAAKPAPSTAAGLPSRRPLMLAAWLLACGGLYSVADYSRVVVIFSPSDTAAPLPQRIADGQQSWFFAHHANYAAATTSADPGKALGAFASASHFLLDARLMQAWATALNDAGDTDRARYVAQRLKEFRNTASADFFEPCDEAAEPIEPTEPASALPFQCLQPQRALTYKDFR